MEDAAKLDPYLRDLGRLVSESARRRRSFLFPGVPTKKYSAVPRSGHSPSRLDVPRPAKKLGDASPPEQEAAVMQKVLRLPPQLQVKAVRKAPRWHIVIRLPSQGILSADCPKERKRLISPSPPLLLLTKPNKEEVIKESSFARFVRRGMHRFPCGSQSSTRRACSICGNNRANGASSARRIIRWFDSRRRSSFTRRDSEQNLAPVEKREIRRASTPGLQRGPHLGCDMSKYSRVGY